MKTNDTNSFDYGFVDRPFYNASEASAYLNIKKASLYNLVWKQQIKPLKMGGKSRSRLRFTKVELDRFLGVENVD